LKLESCHASINMHEFDKFGHDYEKRLEGSIKGLASIDTAIKSKLQVLQSLIDSSRLNGNFRVLDFGCGTGLLSAAMTRFTTNVTGVDVSLESLRNAVVKSGKSVLFNGQQMPFKNDSFSFAVASCVFHHIPSAARSQVLESINRVLAPNGIIIIIEHNPYNPVTRFVVNRCEFDRDAELLSMSLTESLLQAASFEKVDCGYFYAIPPINSALSMIDSWFSKIPLGAQYYCAYQKPR
jgi:ubiquinone/menaquinone biosynthesis C-methylase UbiE